MSSSISPSNKMDSKQSIDAVKATGDGDLEKEASPPAPAQARSVHGLAVCLLYSSHAHHNLRADICLVVPCCSEHFVEYLSVLAR